ncbi:hypothetical protein BDZ91DRAFT_375532 [Kalaharituber pfeilii]|nr:hypothetical protein BDZ91DRAFT_375532 [Kalaharituber pfeilii]
MGYGEWKRGTLWGCMCVCVCVCACVFMATLLSVPFSFFYINCFVIFPLLPLASYVFFYVVCLFWFTVFDLICLFSPLSLYSSLSVFYTCRMFYLSFTSLLIFVPRECWSCRLDFRWQSGKSGYLYILFLLEVVSPFRFSYPRDPPSLPFPLITYIESTGK